MKLKTLKPRLGTIQGRLQVMTGGGWRTQGMGGTARGYGYAWQKARARHLDSHPLCVMCEAEIPSRVTVATVVDHRTPHRGDMTLFWDESNWQSLCAPHHSSDKQRQEAQDAGK